jgi:nitrite reductase/ring-hydroxylating ferredoxin subunit
MTGAGTVSRSSWIKVAENGDVDVDGVRMVKAGAHLLALVRTRSGYGALANACPHMQGPLAQGHIEEGRLVCPWHGRAFDPRTGDCDGYAEAARAFAVEVRADGIYVDAGSPD